ncbi:MAG: hypothetical protein OEM93_14690, partial [Rhodospirillales bacterium]|nr:hypothetical protein [Rhodospirillales bacterium]
LGSFVGNIKETGWFVLALAGWAIGMVGVGIHFYDAYHRIKKKFQDLPDNFEHMSKRGLSNRGRNNSSQ